jgi:hypothetical protein
VHDERRATCQQEPQRLSQHGANLQCCRRDAAPLGPVCWRWRASAFVGADGREGPASRRRGRHSTRLSDRKLAPARTGRRSGDGRSDHGADCTGGSAVLTA